MDSGQHQKNTEHCIKRKSRRRSGNTGRKDKMEYKGFYIDDCMYGLITVQYCGDDLVFGTVDEAKQFIDEVTA